MRYFLCKKHWLFSLSLVAYWSKILTWQKNCILNLKMQISKGLCTVVPPICTFWGLRRGNAFQVINQIIRRPQLTSLVTYFVEKGYSASSILFEISSTFPDTPAIWAMVWECRGQSHRCIKQTSVSEFATWDRWVRSFMKIFIACHEIPLNSLTNQRTRRRLKSQDYKNK